MLDDVIVQHESFCVCVGCYARETGHILRISRGLYRELALILAEVG